MVSKTDPDTILLHERDDDVKEGEANGTVTPGDHLELDGIQTSRANDERQFVRNSSDGAKAAVRVALEYEKTGRGIDDDYSSGDALEYKTLESGEEFFGFVFGGGNAGGTGTDLSANANISVGDRLVAYSGGGQDGTFRNLDTGNGDTEGAAVVEAVEAVDNSGGSDPARIRLEVL